MKMNPKKNTLLHTLTPLSPWEKSKMWKNLEHRKSSLTLQFSDEGANLVSTK